MRNSNVAMNSFVKKIKENYLDKDAQISENTEFTQEFVKKQVQSYSKVLKSEIFKKATK